jgi:uncharacterized protein (DUF362 family)
MKQAIHKALDLIDYSFEKEIRNVVIKPNLCYYWDYSTGQTTDPRFVQALVDMLREKIVPNPSISIVEADASAMKCKHAFKMLGYEKLAKDCNVKLVNLSEEQSDIAEIAVGKRTFRLRVPRTIRDADLRINVPKIKYTSRQVKITCALKNIFGCNPYPKKFRLHSQLEEVIVATNKAMKFNLCIIDGNIISGIQPRRLGLAMASKDPVAIDVAAARVIGLNSNPRYLRLASREALGNMSFIHRGEPLDYFKARYSKQDAKTRLVSMAYDLVVRMRLGKRIGLE